MENKLEKRDKKLLKALQAGGKLAERSISKLAWDIAYGKVTLEAGKMNYRVHQVMDCASDAIARGEWAKMKFSKRLKKNDESTDVRYDHEFPIVIIPYKAFKDFIDEQDLKTEKTVEIFKQVLRIALWGKANIPIYDENFEWGRIHLYGDHICGLAIASEGSFEEYRSDEKLRGKGSKKEEPVFILIFSSPYGLTWFRNAMERSGTQLQDPELYNLHPRAQELFQTVRWNNRLVIMTVESASIAMNLKYPLKNKPRVYERVEFIRKMLKILKDNMFINYDDERFEKGKKIEQKTWAFYVRKKKLIGLERKINRF